MQLRKCYRYRLSPTPEQEHIFLQWAGCRRFVWNWALTRRQEHYRQTGKSLSYNHQAAELTALKNTLPWLKQADSQCLQQVLRDLDQAYQHFFAKRARFPKLKKKYQCPNAFRIPQRVSIKEVSVKEGSLSLPKIGLVALIYHRPLEGSVKSATLKQEASGHWYVTFVTEHELPDPAPFSVRHPVGIDLGLDTLATLSNGQKKTAPKFFRKAEKTLRLAHRRLSRKQKGSKNRQKAKNKLARTSARIKNQRTDFLQQFTTELVRTHDVLCIEDLDLKALAKTKLRGHAKSWQDAAHGALRHMLDYKTRWSGKKLIVVDRFFASSQICHVCQAKQPLSLSDRTWTCSCCQCVHDRDHNAAINLEVEGLRVLALAENKLACV